MEGFEGKQVPCDRKQNRCGGPARQVLKNPDADAELREAYRFTSRVSPPSKQCPYRADGGFESLGATSCRPPRLRARRCALRYRQP